MPKTKRATVYFEESLLAALREKAVTTDTSFSDLVNTAVRRSLAEDADDLATFRKRAREPRLSFEAVAKHLRLEPERQRGAKLIIAKL